MFMRVFYLTDFLSPYRVEWMNLLSEKCEITAYFFDEGEKTRENAWLKSIKNSFEKQQVKSVVLAGIRFSSEIFKILKNNRYDIYIVDGYSSFVQVRVIHWLTQNGKKVYVNVDGIDIWKKETFVSKIKAVVKSGVYQSGAKFLCGSKIAADRLISLGAKEENVYTHPFTSLHTYDIISFEEKLRLQKTFKKKINAENKKVALAVGRFIPLKEYDVLIKAWHLMPDDCILYLIGSGVLKNDYLKLIDELSIKNIVILDHMDRERLNDYYLAADLFVHTSNTEVWGLVFNEAMAKGCPIVSTNQCVGAVELIREGKEGYLIDVGDVETLHEKMLKILYDEPLRLSMMKQSTERIIPYTYENLAKIHIGIFEKEQKKERLQKQ